MSLNQMRGCLYFVARLLGDVSALKHHHVRRRIVRRVVGKALGRTLMRRIK